MPHGTNRGRAAQRPELPAIPPRVFLHPAVLIEFGFNVSPLAGIMYWGWDVFLVVMLHLLALAISGAWLVLRTATLSDQALCYFDTRDKNRLNGARWLLSGGTGIVLGLPLVILTGMIVEQFGGPRIHGLGDFWRVVVVSSGLWLPLGLVCTIDACAFAADVVLPRLKLGLGLPAPRLGPEWAGLSPELQAFLYARAWIVLRMLVTVLAIGPAMVFATHISAIVLVLALTALKTSVAVYLQARAIADRTQPGPLR